MSKLYPGRLEELAWRKNVSRRLEHSPNSQLSIPQPWPATPFGGASAPNSTWFIPVTHAIFDGAQASQPWVIQMDTVSRVGFSIDIPWVTDATTLGEVRLIITGAPNSPTVAKALAAGSGGVVSFRWLHGWEPFFSSDVWCVVEARRVSGAGNVYIGYPQGGGLQVGPHGCSVTG